MSSEEVFEKIKAIIVEQLQVAENTVTEEASFIDDLGADSLDIVELVMALEEEFDMEIPDSDAEKVVTVGDVVEYIKDEAFMDCSSLAYLYLSECLKTIGNKAFMGCAEITAVGIPSETSSAWLGPDNPPIFKLGNSSSTISFNVYNVSFSNPFEHIIIC